MGLDFLMRGSRATEVPSKRQPSNEVLWQLRCKACPRDKAQLQSPKMQPTGSANPLVLIIGEAPGETEDRDGEQFVGRSGELLRPLIPSKLRSRIQWDNVTRCWPGKGNPDPSKVSIECCRPLLTESIERGKPKAIFGMGSVPLSWAGKPGGITLWRGRRFPIQIGTHVCWYYPMFHPAWILRTGNRYDSDDEFVFKLDLRRAFQEVEAGLPPPVVLSAEQMREDIVCVTGEKKGDLDYVLEFLRYASKCVVVGVDYETQRERPYYSNAAILTIAISTGDETIAFAYDHPQAKWQSREREKLQAAFARFLKSSARKAVHSLAFEMEWSCVKFGLDMAHAVPWQDSLTQAFVLDERVGDKVPFGLGFLMSQYYGINVKDLSPKLNMNDMASEPLAKILPYNAIDAKSHLLLYEAQDARLHADKLMQVYQEKLAQVASVVLTQIKGVRIDEKQNYTLQREYERKLKQATEDVEALDEAQRYFRLTQEKFNPSSVPHVTIMLRDVLKVKAESTREEVLEKIDHPICQAILNYRRVLKLKSTYIDSVAKDSKGSYLFPGQMVHTNLGTCFTETGRLESTQPNIQNWPIRTDVGKRVRRQVSAGVFAAFDYGQIDARIIACGSRDRNYCKALWEDYDIHMEWAQRLAHHHPDWVGGKRYVNDADALKKFRSGKVKNSFVFALFYGASLRSTAHRFDVDEQVMRKPYDEFWDQFHDVKVWQTRIAKQYDEHGYVQLFDGLRRRAPLSHGQKINSPVQGATNRIVMAGMNRLSALGDMRLQANLQIHDDLSFCFDTVQDFEELVPTIVDAMLDGREFDWFCVPLVIEAKSGPNWSDLEPIGVFNSTERLGWPIRAKEFT